MQKKCTLLKTLLSFFWKVISWIWIHFSCRQVIVQKTCKLERHDSDWLANRDFIYLLPGFSGFSDRFDNSQLNIFKEEFFHVFIPTRASHIGFLQVPMADICVYDPNVIAAKPNKKIFQQIYHKLFFLHIHTDVFVSNNEISSLTIYFF